jgi:hypothetical protein
MQQNFKMLNHRYFDDLLPEPQFKVGKSRTRLGSLSFKRHARTGKMVSGSLALHLSNYYDQTEHQFQSVLLHEMIHLSIACSGIKDTSPHGIVFRGMMDRLNRDGLNIQVMSHTREMPLSGKARSARPQQFLVLAIVMTNGTRFLSSVNPRFARKINNDLLRVREVAHYHWYATTDRWFETLPQVRSLRGRRVSVAEYEEKVKTMQVISV